MQNEIKVEQSLLNENGELTQKGYAKSLILDYSRDDIKANKMRIKEWDYYLITNDSYAIALTVADNSYMGLISASFVDFELPMQKTTSIMTLMPMGKTNMPSSSECGEVNFENKRVKAHFVTTPTERHLCFEMKKFYNKQTFKCDIVLTDEPKDSMVIATPFVNKPKAFYYNQKIVCMRAQGSVEIGDKKYCFDKNTSFGMLDWGRGVWTYKNTWYWSAGHGTVNNKPFGFNLGYGFGDTSNATENMLFYDGVAHKLNGIDFGIPLTAKGKCDYMKKWHFTSNDRRFEMSFTPIIDRCAEMSVGILASSQHQVFGKFNGSCVLDDGSILEIKDFLGFAERVFNKW